MIAREEEFDRVEFLKQFFETAIVEILSGLTVASRRQGQDLRFDDAIGIKRDGGGLFVGVKKRQQIGLRPHDVEQPVYGILQELRGEELQRIPDESAVEAVFRKIEAFA